MSDVLVVGWGLNCMLILFATSIREGVYLPTRTHLFPVKLTFELLRTLELSQGTGWFKRQVIL